MIPLTTLVGLIIIVLLMALWSRLHMVTVKCPHCECSTDVTHHTSGDVILCPYCANTWTLRFVAIVIVQEEEVKEED